MADFDDEKVQVCCLIKHSTQFVLNCSADG